MMIVNVHGYLPIGEDAVVGGDDGSVRQLMSMHFRCGVAHLEIFD
jgi:hypothetical protein